MYKSQPAVAMQPQGTCHHADAGTRCVRSQVAEHLPAASGLRVEQLGAPVPPAPGILAGRREPAAPEQEEAEAQQGRGRGRRRPATTPTNVNYHFTRQCNYKCGFCFHTAKTSFVLPLEAKRGLLMLKEAGESPDLGKPQVLSHFEKGKEAGVVGGARPGQRGFPGTVLQDTAGCTVARGEVGGELWMDAKIFPTCKWAGMGEQKHHRF